jgi:hypothetical protein
MARLKEFHRQHQGKSLIELLNEILLRELVIWNRPSMLTVLTTRIRPSNPRVREEYTTSLMHIFDINKVPRVVLQFLWTGTQLGGWSQRDTRARHGRTTKHGRPYRCVHPGRCGRPCQVRPHLPCATSLVPNTSFPTCTTWMNEIDQGNVG